MTTLFFHVFLLGLWQVARASRPPRPREPGAQPACVAAPAVGQEGRRVAMFAPWRRRLQR